MIFFQRGVYLRTPDYARRAEPEPPVTMMLSHFSGGHPVKMISYHNIASNKKSKPLLPMRWTEVARWDIVCGWSVVRFICV